MMLLMAGTVVYVPVVLPMILSGISVDAWQVARSLGLQLLMPIAVGMAVVQVLPGIAAKVQRWIGWIGNIALYALIATT